MGCELTVSVNKESIAVEGQVCKIGEKYGVEEATFPTRNITTSVPVRGGDMPMLSVKTQKPIPKGKIFECVAAVKEQILTAPVYIGDVVLTNAAGTGVDIVATRTVRICEKGR
jgi:CxxC motif-containing protein